VSRAEAQQTLVCCMGSEDLGRIEALCPHVIVVFVASLDATQGWDQTFPYTCSVKLSPTSAGHKLQTQGEIILCNSLEHEWV